MGSWHVAAFPVSSFCIGSLRACDRRPPRRQICARTWCASLKPHGRAIQSVWVWIFSACSLPASGVETRNITILANTLPYFTTQLGWTGAQRERERRSRCMFVCTMLVPCDTCAVLPGTVQWCLLLQSIFIDTACHQGGSGNRRGAPFTFGSQRRIVFSGRRVALERNSVNTQYFTTIHESTFGAGRYGSTVHHT